MADYPPTAILRARAAFVDILAGDGDPAVSQYLGYLLSEVPIIRRPCLSSAAQAQIERLAGQIRGWTDRLANGEDPEIVAADIVEHGDGVPTVTVSQLHAIARELRAEPADETVDAIDHDGIDDPVDVEMHRLVEVPLRLRLLARLDVPINAHALLEALKTALDELDPTILEQHFEKNPVLGALLARTYQAVELDIAADPALVPDIQFEPLEKNPDTVPSRKIARKLIYRMTGRTRYDLRWVPAHHFGDPTGFWRATIPNYPSAGVVSRFVVRRTMRDGVNLDVIERA